MESLNKNIKKHPKIIATVVFMLLVAGGSFTLGYKQDQRNINKDGKKYTIEHNVLNGLKWIGIIYTIMIVLAATMAIMLKLNFWDMFLFGGDLISILGHVFVALVSALTN